MMVDVDHRELLAGKSGGDPFEALPGAGIEGEDGGVPFAQIFRTGADFLRSWKEPVVGQRALVADDLRLLSELLEEMMEGQLRAQGVAVGTDVPRDEEVVALPDEGKDLLHHRLRRRTQPMRGNR